MAAEVDALIDDARSYTAETLTAARTLVTDAQNTIQGVVTGLVINPYVLPGTPAIEALPDQPLTTFSPFAVVGTLPAAPTYYNLPALDFGASPEFTEVAPDFVEPAAPPVLRSFLGAEPVLDLSSVVLPTVPAELSGFSIEAPTISTPTLPDAPMIQLPVFDAVVPTIDGTPPADLAENFEANYRGIAPVMMSNLDAKMDAFLGTYNPRFREQLTALEDKLRDYVAGGSALSQAVEDGLYERTRDKNDAEYRRARDTAYGDAARRGFTLPTGVLSSAVRQARQAAADNNARAANEIAIKQAELEQQNIQFALTLSNTLRSTAMNAMLSYHGGLVNLNGQALEYAKAVLDAAVQIYNLLVKSFELKLEGYRIAATVYQTKLQAAQTAIEIYKAQIEGVKVLTDIDRTKVEIYKSRIQAIEVLATAYKAQVDAILSRADLEKLKIELYGARVNAYAAEAGAKTAEYQGYTAAIRGQEARIGAFSEKVKAFGARTEAFRTQVQAKTAQVESVTQYNQGLTAQYVAGIEGYRSINQAAAIVHEANINTFRAELGAFDSKLRAIETVGRFKQEYYRTAAIIGSQNYQVQVQSVLESAKLYTSQIEAVAKTAISGATVNAGVASAALSGMNTIVQKSTEE